MISSLRPALGRIRYATQHAKHLPLTTPHPPSTLSLALSIPARNLPSLVSQFSTRSLATSLLDRTKISSPRRMSTAANDPLVWIDCEMTGLDPDTDSILEIYCLITDGQLELLDPVGWGTVVHQSKERMDAMDEWCTRVRTFCLVVSPLEHLLTETKLNQTWTDGESGLTAAVANSTVTPELAADGLLSYIQKYVPQVRTALLAGNSVHADRAFLRKGPYKKVLDHLHYRILDVSSVKEAARRWW